MENRDNIYLIPLAVILILLAVWSATEFFELTQSDHRPVIAVLVEDSESGRWTQLRLGLEQAQQDYNLRIRFVQTGRYESVEDQLVQAGAAAKEGADGIFLIPVGSEGTQEGLSDLTFSRMVVLGETDAVKDTSEGNRIAVACPDNRAMGADLVRMALREEGKTPRTAGILSGNQDQAGLRDRLEGARDFLEAQGVSVIWDRPRSGSLADELNGLEEPDMILALEDEALLAAADWKQAAGAGTGLYGIGCSNTLAWLLDRGIIGGVIVPDEFGMGYRSAAMIADRLEIRSVPLQDITLSYTEVTPANMYEESIERLLFPEIE